MGRPRKAWYKRIILQPNGCWTWTGSKVKGYGVLDLHPGWIMAHKMTYIIFIGEVDETKHLHHTCENKICVNPWHLEQLTPKEHLEKHTGPRKTHCKHGHEYTPENTYRNKQGYRRCLTCHRKNSLKFSRKNP